MRASEEVSLATEMTRVLIRVISDDFFVFLVLDRQGNYGKERYLLNRAVPILNAALQ